MRCFQLAEHQPARTAAITVGETRRGYEGIKLRPPRDKGREPMRVSGYGGSVAFDLNCGLRSRISATITSCVSEGRVTSLNRVQPRATR